MRAEPATQGGELASHDRLLEDVSDRLRASGLSLAVAESCTGGLLGGALTDVPGASAYFVGGILAYDNAVKVSLLSVSPELLERNGAVSAPVVGAMAQGVRQLLGVRLGIAVTGISGPDGGSDEKPVGTTFLALAAPDMEMTRQFHFTGDRAHVRAQTVQASLALLHEYLEGMAFRKSTER